MKRRALWLTLAAFVALCGVCALWVQREKQQYARNRQLIAALLRDDTKTALALVNAGADPNTPVLALPAPSFKSILDQLLHRSPPPANNSPTAFLGACGSAVRYTNYGLAPPEDVRLVQAMLAHGANLKARDTYKRTALAAAVNLMRRDTVALLLQSGADPNALDRYGATPLMWAVTASHTGIVSLLLAHGANPNIQVKNGTTALYGAVLSGENTDIVSDLLAHGANPNLRTSEGQTPLDLARKEKHSDLVRLLQQHGAK